MKLRFSWEYESGNLSPNCSSEDASKDGIDLLSCLLMDNGGVPFGDCLSWIREGVARIDSVLSGEVTSASWDRESWGMLITINEARIYSLHEESCFQNFTLQRMRVALISWGHFLQTEPEIQKVKVVEL